jgi:ligand-binding sensor domain-containing protein
MGPSEAPSRHFGLIRCLLAGCLLPALLPAQFYSFEYYAHERGLGSLGVNQLAQDRTGFLWVGTSNGLFRYDGGRFRRFDAADGLQSSMIECLHVGPDGTFWVGTRAGLARWTGDRFQPVELGLSYQILARYGLDSEPGGRLYLGTSRGLAIITPSPGTARYVAKLVPVPGAGAKTVYGVHRAPDGNVWFGCGEDLCRLGTDGVRLLGPGDGLPQDRWDAILTDRQGTVWVRSLRHAFALENGAHKFVSRNEGLPAAGYRGGLYLDKLGQLFAPTDRGLARFIGGRWQCIGIDNGLETESTTTALEDHEGSLWIGLWGSGLARWAGYREWQGWRRAQGLNNDDVSSIERDKSGALWVGTD